MITVKQLYNELCKLVAENKGDYEFIFGNTHIQPDMLDIRVNDLISKTRVILKEHSEEETEKSETKGSSSPRRLGKSRTDENGNHYDYDYKGRIVHFKRSDGYEEWTDYDIQGNIEWFKNNHGIEKWFQHDWEGNLVRWGWGNRNPKA